MPYETHQVDTLTVNILRDEDPDNPREAYDNLGTMICFHPRYTLGDKHDHADPEDSLNSLTEQALSNYIILPLYLYEHGGITMYTGSFSCPWDSGQVGWIYMPISTARENWPGLDTFDLRDRARRCLEGEVREYAMYLEGDCWGYSITDADEDDIESCWGFYGLDTVREEALATARAIAASLPKQHELSF
jgi:hypothetical protein